MKKKVAIIGCGPSGLLAAYSVMRAGLEPVIFSRKVKSQMPGAIYMHHYIPDLTSSEPDTMIEFRKQGTREGYARKVYGAGDAPCSWDDFPTGALPGWNLSMVYDRLWEQFRDTVRDQMIGAHAYETLTSTFPLVISSAPAPAMCRRPGAHIFESADIWIRAQKRPLYGRDEIIYNGDPLMPWYRSSQLFGHSSFEFGHRILGPDVVEGRKPIRTNCDCQPGVVRIGRFGKWQKGVLTTDAYREARVAVQQLQ
jgi:hypothetical protein